jgi:tripartite-type tricarboxylate transporter receptor subunit TctC
MRKLWIVGLVGVLLSGAASAQAPAPDAYPNKPIRLVVTFPAGGAIDVLSRILAEQLTASLGQRVLIDNRAGMGGTMGADVVAKAPPDGYTLVTASAASHAINKALFHKIPYDPETDFAPISMFATVPVVLVVNPSLPAHSVAEFIAEAKRRPGLINYASVGNGSSQHLAGAYFELRAGVKLQHVPYKTVGSISTDLVANEIQSGFLFISNIINFIETKQVRALAVTSRTRMPALADLPTMIEAGLPDYEYVNWFGVMGPAGLPADIVERLHRAIVAACAEPELKKRFSDLGALTVGDDPAHFARFVHDEIPKWDQIVKASGAHID